MGRVFVDTNVLFPFSLMDLMLALTEDAVHQVVWTERLLDEWERVIVREQQRSPDAARSVTRAVRTFFDDCRIAEERYAHLLDTVQGPDPDDRHHMAAALAADVDALVTWNLQDFPTEQGGRRVRVIDPDTYLCELLVALPAEVVATVRRLAAEKRRPPITATDLAERFAKAGVLRFAARLEEAVTG